MNGTRDGSWLTSLCGDMTARDRQNLNRANLWMMLWLVCFAASTWLIRADLVQAGPVGWLVAIFPTAVGVGTLLAFGRYFREADELQRRIQLQALAVGFGVALFAGFGYRLFEALGAPAGRVSDLAVVMVVFYFVGLWMGRRRYA